MGKATIQGIDNAMTKMLAMHDRIEYEIAAGFSKTAAGWRREFVTKLGGTVVTLVCFVDRPMFPDKDVLDKPWAVRWGFQNGTMYVQVAYGKGYLSADAAFADAANVLSRALAQIEEGMRTAMLEVWASPVADLAQVDAIRTVPAEAKRVLTVGSMQRYHAFTDGLPTPYSQLALFPEGV